MLKTANFIDNMEYLCRLCLEKLPENGSFSLFSKNGGTKMLEMIFTFTSILVEDEDKPPNFLCPDCTEMLLKCNEFREKCLEANQMLTTHLEKKKTKEDLDVPVDVILKSANCRNPTSEETYSKIDAKEISVDIETHTKTLKPDVFLANEVVKTREIAHNENNKAIYTKKKKTKRKSLEVTRKNKKTRKNQDKPVCYKCEFCHKVYPSEGGWRYHVHTMHSQSYQPFICDLCGKAFKVKKNMEVHKRSVHLKLKENLCDVCGQKFATKYGLRVHQVWHTGERKYECQVCKAKFASNGKLNTHLIIHEGFKKFMCEICSRVFRWKKDFVVHMRTHTGEKPYVCKICNKAFASLTNKRKHESSHSKNSVVLQNTASSPTEPPCNPVNATY